MLDMVVEKSFQWWKDRYINAQENFFKSDSGQQDL